MTLTEYCHWAKSPVVKSRPRRRPLSQGPFVQPKGVVDPAPRSQRT